MADPKRINGNQYSWSSIVSKAKNETWNGFTSINYGDGRERVKSYGQGKHHAPRGRSAGKYVPEPLVVKMAKGTKRDFIAMLARQAPDGKSFGNVSVDFTVQYIEADEGVITDVIEGCVISKQSASHEEGADPLFDEVTFDVMRIRWDGKNLFDASQGSP